jgi:hypothetical protein
MLVTRLAPGKATNPHLKELFEFAEKNNIVFTRGNSPALTEGSSLYVSVPDQALRSESALAQHMEQNLKEYFGSPVLFEKLPPQSQKIVRKMKENFQTRFIHESQEFGNSYFKENMIGIRAMHPDNLRVNQVVFHETTHNTTDRKIYDIFNSTPDRHPPKLTTLLAGREMRFRAKTAQSMNMPPAVDGYHKLYRSDEIEATYREMAQAKKDNLSLEKPLKEISAFMDTQEKQIISILEKEDFKISRQSEEPELGGGRRQRRYVTSDHVNFEIEVLVPKGLSFDEERTYIKKVLKDRLKVLDHYRQNIKERLLGFVAP